jgi:proteasome alpha subunit
MYEEPYRWVEAVGNRRQYLDEQFKQGSPVVALAYGEGILLLTVNRGTPKLYEIYDRIGLGGMGHPADLEKLRFSLLEMAHLEGFNRSPADVTGARLMKYGLAPIIKQAFEEIFKAPLIVKILLAELSLKPGKDAFLTVNYDGGFEETTGSAVLAATPAIQAGMTAYLKKQSALESAPLQRALETALRAWAVGSLAQSAAQKENEQEGRSAAQPTGAHAEPDESRLVAYLREVTADKTIECAVLERNAPGSSKYRTLKVDELFQLLPT